MPRLLKAFPRATATVEQAARAGERGTVVTTCLGRSSPPVSAEWREAQLRGSGPEATVAEQRKARQRARDWGRFTRNFVVQGTGAEWALCWIADLRNRLHALGGGETLDSRPHLVFFLHDEVVVHTPAGLVDEVVAALEGAATGAGALLFRDLPVDFPLNVSVVRSYAEAGKAGAPPGATQE